MTAMDVNISSGFIENLTHVYDDGVDAVAEDRGWWMRLFCPLLLGMLTCLTVTGNGIILMSFVLEPALRKLDNAFIISLSVADFMVGLTVMPMYVVWVVTGGWPFLEVGCYLWQIADCLSSTASFWTLLAMAVDRYITLRQPFNKFSDGRRKRIIALTVMVWVLPAAYWIPPLVAIPLIRGIDLVANCESTYKEFTLATSILIYNLPTLLMVIFYSLIMYEVSKVKRSPNAHIGGSSGGSGQNRRDDKKPKCSVSVISYKNTSSESHSDCSRTESNTSGVSSMGTVISTASSGDGERRPLTVAISESKTSSYAAQMQNARLLQEAKIRQRMQRHTVRMLGTIMACFLFCWILWDINWPLAWYLPENSIPEALHSVSCWLAYGNSALNPFVYCFSNPVFWKSIKKVLLCKSRGCCRNK